MIITCKKEVPFRWILFAVLPWIAYAYNSQTMGVAFLFSLKKFVENPAGLTFIMSLPGFISIFIVPLVNFLSDRIWTRFGRRKPFILSAWVGVTGALILMPLMPNFWSLLAIYVIYNLFNDVGSQTGPMDPLCQEIVPPHQRGTSTGMNQWLGNLTTMVFFYFALGRFDDVRFMAGVPISGEKAIYWSAGLIVAAMFLCVSLGIKEVDQKSSLRGQRLNFRNFFSGIMDRELWPVFMLVFSVAMLNSSLGSLGNLLYTDQWNYTKQEMGVNVVIGGVINMFVIMFLTLIADKLNRMKAYQVLITIALFIKASYFIYINYVLPDHRPTLVELVVFGETLSIVGILTGMVYNPLVYDYVTRNKMGTYAAGAGILTKITYLITLNGIGLFVWGYALIFQPPAGEMTRVCLKNETTQSEIRSLVESFSWHTPQTGTHISSSEIHAKSWMANGIDLTSGNCFEIRLSDKTSEALAADKENLGKQIASLSTEQDIVRTGQSPSKHARLNALAAKTAALSTHIKTIDTELTTRAKNLQSQVQHLLGARIIKDGDQVLGAKIIDSIVIEFSTAKRPNGPRLEKMLTDLRSERPDIIDLRPIKHEQGYSLAVSLIDAPGTDDKRLAQDLQTALLRIAAKRSPGLIHSSSFTLQHHPALALDLQIVEEPLDWRVSPIMRIANSVLRLFGNAPTPDRKLSAIARGLRLPTESDHVRVYPGPNHTKSIAIIALLKTGAAKANNLEDPVSQRLAHYLAKQPSATIAQARAFYDRVVTIGKGKQITVARPFINAAYAPIKYDYMAGYICMFVLGLFGLGLTFKFQQLERKGLIQKRGMEEAEIE